MKSTCYSAVKDVCCWVHVRSFDHGSLCQEFDADSARILMSFKAEALELPKGSAC